MWRQSAAAFPAAQVPPPVLRHLRRAAAPPPARPIEQVLGEQQHPVLAEQLYHWMRVTGRANEHRCWRQQSGGAMPVLVSGRAGSRHGARGTLFCVRCQAEGTGNAQPKRLPAPFLCTLAACLGLQYTCQLPWPTQSSPLCLLPA